MTAGTGTGTGTGTGAVGAAARRLWSEAAGDSRTLDEVVNAAERLTLHLRLGLGRWIGAQGYQALLARALKLALADHPALAAVPSLAQGLAPPSGRAKGPRPDQLVEGMIALLSEMIGLLSRILGEEMTLRLVEQIGLRGPRRIVGAETERGHDG